MNRRKFLQQSALSSAGTLLLPFLFAACKKANLFEEKKYEGKVMVIGAGASGLYSAYLLHHYGVDVQVLEAADKIGGRVRPLQNFADFTIELGAEEVHGERSLWHDMILASGASFIEEDLNDLFYFNGALKTKEEGEQNTFFNQMNELIATLPDYAGNDISAAAWANGNGLSDNIMHLFNAAMGNEQGTTDTRVGMIGLRDADNRWTAGNENLMVKNSHLLSVMETTFSGILNKVQLNTVVTQIDYTASRIQIQDSNGNMYEADKVIVTIPLPVLKSGAVSFNPPLEEARIGAWEKIGMDRGMKIIIKFDERLWPENTASIYGSGYIPEFRATGAGGRGTDNILTAFVCGASADILATLSEEALIEQVLSEVDNLFEDASTHYVDHYIQDWGAEPFAGGAYSYGKPGSGNARELMAVPIQEKIFFAGEATHTGGHHATVHGAMETGLRAVNEILSGQ
ncbi:MAG: FAD-dependent oxidoreductase [Flavobacteriales bacterium]